MRTFFTETKYFFSSFPELQTFDRRNDFSLEGGKSNITIGKVKGKKK